MAKLVAQYEYSDAELLALYREALAAISQNKSYVVRGKTLTRADEDFIWDMIKRLENRIGTRDTGGVVYAKHGRR